MSTLPIKQIVSRALEKRSQLIRQENRLVRLIDGAGDGLPGHYLELYGDAWLLSTTGERLSPDIEAFFRSQKRSVYWKRLDQQNKTAPTHLAGPEIETPFSTLENGVATEISFQAGYSQGIFIDQRDNRDHLRQLSQPGKTVLNTFAYTGMFSVFAATAGATTTTLDLSQIYLDWAKRNFQLNALGPNDHYFCKGDTFHWLKRFAKQDRKFDAIVLDPPTFSRDQKGTVFRVENDYAHLLQLALACLAPHGTVLACTNCRRLSLSDFKKQLATVLPSSAQISSHSMPSDFTELDYLKSLWIDP